MNIKWITLILNRGVIFHIIGHVTTSGESAWIPREKS